MKQDDRFNRIIGELYGNMILAKSQNKALQNLIFKLIEEKYPEMSDSLIDEFNEDFKKLANEYFANSSYADMIGEDHLKELLKSVDGKNPNPEQPPP